MRHAPKFLATFSALALAACSQQAEQDADNAFAATENAVANASADAGNAFDNASLALTPTPSPQEFADTAAKSDAFEIAAAELAATNAQSAAVKDFAKMMIAAHKDSSAKIKSAAAAGNVTPNAEMTAEQKDDLAELRGLKAAAFDEEYIDGQVDAHEDALALMRKYAADGEAAELKAAAAEIAPVVEGHLTRARALEKPTDQ